jgi:hypothetical protein
LDPRSVQKAKNLVLIESILKNNVTLKKSVAAEELQKLKNNVHLMNINDNDVSSEFIELCLISFNFILLFSRCKNLNFIFVIIPGRSCVQVYSRCFVRAPGRC